METELSAAQVSVIIPTYRRPALVPRAVQSALAQTLRAIEVIVVMDGPDPATECALAGIRDPRLQIVRLPIRRGLANARNAGIAFVRTRWVALLDGDDEWFSEKLDLTEFIRRIPFKASAHWHEDVDWLLRANTIPGFGVEFVTGIQPLAIWHIETDHPRMSNAKEWRFSVAWARRARPHDGAWLWFIFAHLCQHHCPTFLRMVGLYFFDHGSGTFRQAGIFRLDRVPGGMVNAAQSPPRLERSPQAI